MTYNDNAVILYKTKGCNPCKMSSDLTVQPLVDGGSFGAEIIGVDLATICSDDVSDDCATIPAAALHKEICQSIYQAFLAFGVLVFRNQHGLISPEKFIQVAKMFGEVSDYPFAKGMEGHPLITEIIKEPHQTSNFGGMWHSDTTYLEQPPKCTLLYAVQTPPYGLGDTLFADMYRAYDQLSDELKAKLEGRRVIQSSSLNAAVLRGDHLASGSMQQKVESPAIDDTPPSDGSSASGSAQSSTFQTAHPAVRTHPETGRKALFVNPSHSAHFEDETTEQSKSLLDQLFQHSIRPEFTLRISWEPGTLVVWDNRCLIHCAINDYNGHRRVMRRITIAGDVPY